jgi:hypothetical protein
MFLMIRGAQNLSALLRLVSRPCDQRAVRHEVLMLQPLYDQRW